MSKPSIGPPWPIPSFKHLICEHNLLIIKINYPIRLIRRMICYSFDSKHLFCFFWVLKNLHFSIIFSTNYFNITGFSFSKYGVSYTKWALFPIANLRSNNMDKIFIRILKTLLPGSYMFQDLTLVCNNMFLTQRQTGSLCRWNYNVLFQPGRMDD